MIDVVLFCLAFNVYFEARGEPLQGQYAVAEVTMARADTSGRGICEEVFLDRQFSWNHIIPRPKVTNKTAWEQSLRVALLVMEGRTNYSKGATHFHEQSIRPKWSRNLCKVAHIGKHIFYRRCEP